MRRFAVLAGALALTVVGAAGAAELPTAKPESVGLSSERLARITDVFAADTKSGRLSGAVLAIVRDGKLAYFKAIGERDPASHAPMRGDEVFRLYSMSKPFTSVAAMILVERGQLYLGDPVAKYIPAFKEMQVGVVKTDAATGKSELATEPARRQITIQDLMRHTSGLVYGVLFKSTPVKELYKKAGIYERDQTLAEMVDKLAHLPLAHQPGEVFDYSHSTDVLGRVVEVVSGMPLDQFVAKNITGPLGLRDTGYFVPKAAWGRIAEPAVDPKTGKPPPLRDLREPQKLLSGGGGMVGTARDYLRFMQMLLNGGTFDGARILSAADVHFMTSDHLGSIPHDTDSGSYLLGSGYGFGLGFAVRLADGLNTMPGTKGDFYWGGAGGTQFWIDPERKLLALMMIQQQNEFDHYWRLYRDLVYQAVVR
jgi:CubicO group peptidase (beta-lactamase class C family)